MTKRFWFLSALGILAVALAVPAAFGAITGNGQNGPDRKNQQQQSSNFDPAGPTTGGGYGGMMGMMSYGNLSYANQPVSTVTVDEKRAEEIVQNYVNSFNSNNLEPAEIMEFDNNFYVELKEKDGKYAQELLIDKRTGAIYPEMGPNMMWNVKYGHMGGMMTGYQYPINGTPTVSAGDSIKIAGDYLASAGLKAAEPHEFYGYYTLHALDKDGKIVGMLSVNSYTGQVWYHTWHGNFISMKELTNDRNSQQNS